MKTRLLIIIGIGILIVVSSTYFTIDYLENKQQNEDAHNNRFVKNCIPGGPDKIVPSILIQNQTHEFDLGNCMWILKN
ncbi:MULTISPECIES: hypothetical protein [Nitrosopumilus]|nr:MULTISPECIES: hypothetical protein [Nitrosopumilus]